MHARVIVEYGPGVGTVSQQLLRRLRVDGHLILVEMNEDFVALLRERISDPRVTVVHGSAVNIRQILRDLHITGADYIISGIPYSTIPISVRCRILRESRAIAAEGGEVIVYQFMRTVERHLRDCFDEVVSDFEALNLPPARVWYCR